MELKLYLKMLRNGWWLILLTSLMAVTVSLVVSYVAIPQYEASARFIITPGSSLTQGQDVVDSLDTLDRRSVVATYAEVMSSQRILNNSRDSLQLSSELMDDYSFNAVVLPDANVLELTVVGPNPTLAAQLVNTMGYQTILFSSSLNMSFDLNFLDEASVPVVPVSPAPVQDAGIAFILGVLGGCVLAILSEQIRIPLETYRQRLRMDTIAGVYNKRYFHELLNAELIRDPEDVLAIGIVEIRGIRELMGSLPMSGFQSLLKEVTGVLQKELRGHDIVARWDDISFVVMLPSTPGIAAKRTFDRIYQALSKEVNLNNYDISIFLEPYIGGAVYSNLITSQELIAKAVDSLEQARTGAGMPVFLWSMNSPFWVEK